MSATVHTRRRGAYEFAPGKVRITEVLRVELGGDVDDTPRNAFLNCGVSPNDGHAEDAGVLARDFSVSVVEAERGKNLYDVSVVYESPDPGQSFGDPVLDDPVIRFGGRIETALAVVDKDGVPLLTSSAEPFNPPYELQVHPPVITIERNESTASSADMRSYRDSVNASAVTIAGHSLDARQALMIDWSATSFRRDTYFRWAHRYEIAIADGVWDIELADAGLFYFDSATPPVRRRIKVEGEPVAEPHRLDGSGGPLDPDAPPAATVFLPFRVRKEANWSTLSLPTVLPT